MNYLKNRIVQAVIIVALLLLVFVPPLQQAVFESAPFQSADAAGEAYVDAAFDRALIAFALARATNAVISVIQESELDVAPAGIGVTIAVGELLDPINDLIERFSLVMLVSLVSLGIQKFLIAVVPWFSLKLIFAPALALLLASLWPRGAWRRTTAHLGRKLLLLALLLRFSVPAVALLNDQVYRLFLDRPYSEAITGLEQGKQTVEAFTPLVAPSDGESGLMANLKASARKLQEAADLPQQIERLGERLDGMIRHLLAMLVIFVLNTVLLPLLFLWLFYRLLLRLTGGWTPPPAVAAAPQPATPERLP